MVLAEAASIPLAHSLLDVFRHALLITGFVFVMMLVIEYLNVLTRGAWQQKLTRHRWGQYLVAAVLGATPGCLGAFAVVAMYAHRTVTIGAVVTAMIATAGDETFVMIAVAVKEGVTSSISLQLLAIMGILFVVSIPSGVLTDLLFGRRFTAARAGQILFEVHEHEECFARGELVKQWRDCTAARGILAAVLALFMLGIITGQFGAHGHSAEPVNEHHEHAAAEGDHAEAEDAHGEQGHGHGGGWGWIRITLLVVTAVALFIVATVPDHFLEEHLWRHVARKHALQIFLWTLGALLALYVLLVTLDLEHVLHAPHYKWVIFGIACLMGLIPESGPHLILLFLFIDGNLPFSILLANTIIQDGHGMLPLLAHSRRAFFGVKAVNLAVGAAIGAVLLAIGI